MMQQRSFVLPLVLIFTSVITIAAFEAKSLASEATLADAQKFISESAEGEWYVVERGIQKNCTTELRDSSQHVSFDGCDLTARFVREFTVACGAGAPATNSSPIRSKRELPNFVPGSCVAKRLQDQSDTANGVFCDGAVGHIVFIRNRQLAERVAKAMNFAVEQCRDKGKPW